MGEDETLLRLSASLTLWWGARGLWRENDTWVTVALERASPSSPPIPLMMLLREASTLARRAGDYRRAEALTAEWLQLAEEEGEADEDQLLMAMNSAAFNALEQGDVEGARAQFAAIGKRADMVGNRRLVAFATVNLGAVALESRDFESSLEYSANAAELFREIGDDGGVWTSLDSCGWSAIALSDLRRAEDSFREALLVVGRVGAKRAVGQSACGLGATLIALHEPERGVQLIGAAGALFEEVGRGLDDELMEGIRERAVAEARAVLGADAFAAAWARGEAMTLEEIVELAS